MMRARLHTLFAVALVACAAAIAPAGAADRVGIVMLHGLYGAPLGESRTPGRPPVGGTLIPALRAAGYLVATPEMCYSHRRAFDRAFGDCFADIDAAIADLKAQGATAIVLGGQSMGGLFTLAYAATHAGLAAAIACAPAPDITRAVRVPEIAAALERARAAVAAGNGDAVVAFPVTNTGPQGRVIQTVHAAPRAYLSFYDGESPASLYGDLPHVTAPILWVAGTRDPSQPAAAPGDLPANALTRFVTVDSDHLGTADAGTHAILAWLATVVPQN